MHVSHLAHEGRIRLPRDLAVHLGACAAQPLWVVEPLIDEWWQRQRGSWLHRECDRHGEIVKSNAARMGDEEDVAEQPYAPGRVAQRLGPWLWCGEGLGRSSTWQRTAVARTHADEIPMLQKCEAATHGLDA